MRGINGLKVKKANLNVKRRRKSKSPDFRQK